MSRSPKSDYVIGRIPVFECLRAGRRRAVKLFVLDSAKGLEEIAEAAKRQSIPIDQRSRRDLDRMSGDAVHQGVILEADSIPLLSLDAWLARQTEANSILVVLDGIEDPRNFGAIVRSASACGAAGVLFAKDRSAPVSSAAMKAATGAMEYIDLIQVTNLARALGDLKDAGYWAACFDASAEQSLWEANLTGKMALVIGSEGKGVRRLVRESCDLELKIPQSGPITSLNASVSAAIALYECLRQRSK